jgi:hypothetical protein
MEVSENKSIARSAQRPEAPAGLQRQEVRGNGVLNIWRERGLEQVRTHPVRGWGLKRSQVRQVVWLRRLTPCGGGD